MRRVAATAVLVVLCAVGLGAAADSPPAGAIKGFYETYWRAASMPRTRATLSSKLDENVASIAVVEGQAVKKGDVLLRFDSRT